MKLLVAAATALLLAAPAARAADPFYERLLRDGGRELAQGDAAAAVRDLRIAAFGLLDEPARLAEALVPLALAQAALGDGAAFEETFGRIVDIEDRFGAFTAAELSVDLRRAFAERAAALIPTANLARSAAFREIAQAKREAQIERLGKRERRQQVEALIAAEPDEPRWLLLLGRLELEDRNRERAVELATRVLTLRPQEPRALCLRGLAHAEAERCAEAIPDLEACEESRTNPAVARLLLDCLAGLDRWSEARLRLDLLEQAVPAVKDDRSLAKLRRQILRQAPAEPEPADATTSATENGAEPAAETPVVASDEAPPTARPAAAPAAPPAPTPPSPPAPAAPLTVADRDALSRARVLLRQARVAEDLDEASRLARDVADRNPESAEAQLLAGEVAYRASRWSEAAEYFARGRAGAEQPELLFYMAVAFYETGNVEAAREALARALPGLRRTSFVDGYIQKITPPTVAP